MVIMAEEESDYIRRFIKYVDNQSENKKIPKGPKTLLRYLHDLMTLFVGEEYIVEQECSEHESASWANIIIEYEVLYPMNGFYQSDSSNRLVNKKITASLMYWKDEEYHSLSFAGI